MRYQNTFQKQPKNFEHSMPSYYWGHLDFLITIWNFDHMITVQNFDYMITVQHFFKKLNFARETNLAKSTNVFVHGTIHIY